MNRLRQLLKDEAPELHEALERSWKIAVEEWLGALKPSKGSYNAYPHLHNVENYLDQILAGIQPDSAGRARGCLTPAELYVLLSAVLLHDVGRAREGKPNHPKVSQGTVEGQYAHLGIPSRELARCIGNIAAAHGRPLVPDKKGAGNAGREQRLFDVTVDPHGEIRQESLAALLRLADYMDSAFTRVVPRYVLPENELELLGQFRDVIPGVSVDHEGRMVKTVVAAEKFRPEHQGQAKVDYSIVHPYDESSKADWDIISAKRALPPDIQLEGDGNGVEQHDLDQAVADTINLQRQTVEDAQKKAMKGTNGGKDSPDWKAISATIHKQAIVVLAYEEKRHPRGTLRYQRLLPYRALNEAVTTFDPQDWLVVRRVFQVDADTTPPPLPPHALLAVVMSDVLANARELSASRAELSAVGLPLAAWLIDFEEHLYNTWGEETFEPVLSRGYLVRVADGMWELSTRVFGFSLFSYADLASAIGDVNVARVRRAVRRLGIVAGDCATVDGRQMPAIWVGANDWKWNVEHPRDKPARAGCSFVHVSEVRNLIELLGEPHEERV
jgi:hypothetical protein